VEQEDGETLGFWRTSGWPSCAMACSRTFVRGLSGTRSADSRCRKTSCLPGFLW